MDNGEVIVALNEDWSFAGATLPEWMSGFVVFLISTEMFDKISRSMPLLLLMWLGTTFLLATARKSFPDEERGLQNYLVTCVGFVPPGLPSPSKFNPFWSTCPMRQLPETTHYNTLQLDDVIYFGAVEEDQTSVFKPRTTKKG